METFSSPPKTLLIVMRFKVLSRPLIKKLIVTSNTSNQVTATGLKPTTT